MLLPEDVSEVSHEIPCIATFVKSLYLAVLKEYWEFPI